MTLDNGTKIRVIGGKHKGKWGHIIREMNEFSIVRLKEYVKSISLGDDEDVIVERQVRAKNMYVEVIPETVFEMPDESDLISVFSMPSDAEHQTVVCGEGVEPETLNKLIQDMKMPIPENDDDLLSNHSDEDEVDISAETKDPFDITDTLPSITEALQLRKDVRDLTTKNKELTEALDLFVKLCDFVSHRHTSGIHHSDSV